jgi:hypothetical protein
MRALDLAVQLWRCRLDVGVLDSLVLDMPVEPAWKYARSTYLSRRAGGQDGVDGGLKALRGFSSPPPKSAEATRSLILLLLTDD